MKTNRFLKACLGICLICLLWNNVAPASVNLPYNLKEILIRELTTLSHTWTAAQTFSSAITMANNQKMVALNTVGAPVTLAQLTNANIVRIGDSNNSNYMKLFGPTTGPVIDSTGRIGILTNSPNTNTQLDVQGLGSFSSGVSVPPVSKGTTGVLTTTELRASSIRTTASITLTLPQTSADLVGFVTAPIFVSGAYTVNMDCNAADRINLSGTDLDLGDKIVNSGTTNEMVQFICDAVGRWSTLNTAGVWTDNGP